MNIMNVSFYISKYHNVVYYLTKIYKKEKIKIKQNKIFT